MRWAFFFITEGIESALTRARAAAGGRNAAIAGGAATINQYLRAGLIDEIRTHIAPVALGAGERLFDRVPGRDMPILAARSASLVTHVTYRINQ
jgi:dihydrofolate reductase